MSRITFEILRRIPKKPVRIRTEILRGGKRVQLIKGELIDENGTTYLTAHSWLIRIDRDVSPIVPSVLTPPPPVDDCPQFTVQISDSPDIFDAMELRAAHGTPFAGTPASAWIRPKVPLVAGVSVSPYSAVPFAADSANGIAQIAPFGELIAINTDLTVYFARAPEGEWLAIEAATISYGLGLGITDTLVYDASGFVGRSNQSIFFDTV